MQNPFNRRVEHYTENLENLKKRLCKQLKDLAKVCYRTLQNLSKLKCSLFFFSIATNFSPLTRGTSKNFKYFYIAI